MSIQQRSPRRSTLAGKRPSLLMALEPRMLYDGAGAEVVADAAAAEALAVIEITTASGRYDYESKYTPGASTHIVPAALSKECTEAVQAIAVRAFTACGCSGAARVDIMLSEEEQPYVIEVNAVPGMTETSLVPDAARAVGMEFPELCEKILTMAGYYR